MQNKKQNKTLFKRTMLGAACALALAGTAGSAMAANWLMLQGTEPAGASARAEVWGFIQADYQADYSVANPTAFAPLNSPVNNYAAPKMLGPNLNSQAGFNVSRARIGVRGTGFPIDDHINYFLLLEMGNNGTTRNSNSANNNAFTSVKATDASITLNYIKGARVRAGLFKYPGAEESLQAIQAHDYINFTEVTNGLLLERFPNQAFTPCPVAAAAAPVCNGATGNLGQYSTAQLLAGASLNGFKAPAGAFRDTGIQVFDAFNVGKDWELSYAGMIGNGSGIEFDNADGKYDKYAYVSAEKKYGGTGPKAEGLKYFAWTQRGSRLIDLGNGAGAGAGTVAAPSLTSVDRNRSGFGVKYLKQPYRVTAEYIKADGMIFVGTDKPNFYFTSFSDGSSATARGRGWYVEGGWYIPNSRVELDARFDTVDRNEDRANEFRFNKWTLGTQYHFNAKTRLTINYEIRDFKMLHPAALSPVAAPAVASAANSAIVNAANNLNTVGNKLGVQLTASF